MISMRFSRTLCRLALPVLALPLLSWTQSDPLSASPAGSMNADRGSSATAILRVELRAGHHVNSHTPSDEYLIPLELTWEADPLAVEEITYPVPRMESYAFSSEPLSVYTGDFEIETRFRVPEGTPTGERTISGKLRYQACTNRLCLPPKTLQVKLPAHIR